MAMWTETCGNCGKWFSTDAESTMNTWKREKLILSGKDRKGQCELGLEGWVKVHNEVG